MKRWPTIYHAACRASVLPSARADWRRCACRSSRTRCAAGEYRAERKSPEDSFVGWSAVAAAAVCVYFLPKSPLIRWIDVTACEYINVPFFFFR